MLRITKEADYGVMLLAAMAARREGAVHSAKEASAWTGLPLPMVSKILRSLAREGLLTSHRGAAGGYSLDQRPDAITVADVIRALEGPIALVQCLTDPGACEQEACCPTRLNWNRISNVVERALEEVTVADMVPPREGTLLEVELSSHGETQ